MFKFGIICLIIISDLSEIYIYVYIYLLINIADQMIMSYVYPPKTCLCCYPWRYFFLTRNFSVYGIHNYGEWGSGQWLNYLSKPFHDYWQSAFCFWLLIKSGLPSSSLVNLILLWHERQRSEHELVRSTGSGMKQHPRISD